MLEKLKNIADNTKGKHMDFTFLLTLLILLAIGLIALSSASSYYALTEYGNSSYYLVRQMFFAIAGIIAMIIVSKIDYKEYKKWTNLAFIISIVLMLMVFLPGLGTTVKGARRWLNFGLFTFQPSEVAKFVLILFLAQNLIISDKS